MKKLFIPAMALMVALASCSKPTPATDSAQTSPVDSLGEANKALVKKYMETILTGNTAGMADFLADGYMGRGPAMKDSVNKQQDIDNWKKSWAEQFSSIKYDEVVSLTPSIKPETNSRVAGDWVLTWGTISAEHKNGMPPIKFNLHVAYRITNGKIDRSQVYYNVADILTQEGFTFVPPKKETKK
jgi:hypothetical protein